MNVTLHIFKKDVRHLWRMILGSLVIWVTFVVTQINAWPPADWPGIDWPGSYIRGLATMLMPVAWFLLIGFAVHEEGLVSDSQFWMGRPYTWKSLLAAKAVFIAVFINLPLLAAHFVMLAGVGFDPIASVPGLLWKQLMLSAVIVLPAFAMASVTAGFVQFASSALGFAVYVIVLRLLGFHLVERPPSTEWMLELLAGFLMAAASLTVLLRQYARRSTNQSRGVLICGGVLVAAACWPAPWNAVTRFAGSASKPGGAPWIQLALVPDKRLAPGRPLRYPWSRQPGEVEVLLPVVANGLRDGMDLGADWLNATIRGAAGEIWHYSGNPRESYNPSSAFVREDENTFLAGMLVDRSFLERAGRGPADLNISLELTLFRDAGTRLGNRPRRSVRA